VALGLAGALLATVPCRADPTFGGVVQVTSDYVYHGLSQTCGHPAVQADAHLHGRIGQSTAEAFGGLWTSIGLTNADCGNAYELDPYLGFTAMSSRNTSVTLTYIHYAHPYSTYPYPRLHALRYDYDAFEGTWAYQDLLYLTVAWTPNTFRYTGYSIEDDRSAFSYGLQLHVPLGTAFTASLGLGYDEFSDPTGAGYAYGSAGLSYTTGPWQFEVSYVETSERARTLFGDDLAGNRVAVTATWRF
jgi:uncharacterized protein (TIGR02001 family)